MIKTNLINAIIIGLFSTLISCTPTNKNNWNLNSPNGKISIDIELNSEGELCYSISNSNTKIINQSKLGIELDKLSFSNNLSLVSVESKENIEDSYTLLSGKKSKCYTIYNQKEIVLANSEAKQIKIAFRAYNDGTAFRYLLEEDGKAMIVKDELTEFSVNPNGKAWMQDYDWWSPAYEALYENKIYIGKRSNKHREDGWSYPALFEIEGKWMLITEANNNKYYCATHIRNKDESPVYKVCLAQNEMGWKDGIIDPEITTPWVSPWRVMIIGDLSTIVESNLVTDVSDACKIDDTDWIKPGKAAWSWLYEPNSPKDYTKLKKYIDLAADMNWKYCLIDANWNIMKNGNIQQLANYAKTKNVGLILWYNSGGPHNDVTEQPRDLMHDSALRKKEFEKIQKWGIKGVKIDFFQSDKQDIMALYIDILEDASKYKIMVNFHGSTIPKGWSRTYPNLVSMEAVKGSEWYLFDKAFTYVAGRHNAILPYTRNVIGSMDYTPVCFSQNKYLHVTSHAHELALSVVFESGIMCFGDKAESFLSQPEKVKNFLKVVPSTWDNTKFLSGYPGKSFVVARQKGNDWYIGGINGYYFDEEINVDLSFLGDKKYTVDIIKDGEDKESFGYESITYPETKSVKINALAEGGFVMQIKAK